MINIQVQKLSVLDNLSLPSEPSSAPETRLKWEQASAGHSMKNNLIIEIIVTRIVQSDVVDRSVDRGLHPHTLLKLGEDIIARRVR